MNLQHPLPTPRRKAGERWPWIAGILVFLIISAAVGARNRPAEPTSPAARQNTPSTTTTSTSEDTPAAGRTTTTTATTATTAGASRGTTTVRDTTTTKPPPAPPEVFRGRGDKVVSLRRRTDPGILTFECPMCTGNVIVESDGPESLLVNTIGGYTGRKMINIADGSMTTSISVRARGSWRLTVAGVGTIETVTGKPAAGQGDSVLMMTSTFSTATITNQGRSNFVVKYVDLSTGTMRLAVNEIGGYQGTVRMSGPSVVLVESSGTWSITPS